jgi:hypothetical protein
MASPPSSNSSSRARRPAAAVAEPDAKPAKPTKPAKPAAEPGAKQAAKSAAKPSAKSAAKPSAKRPKPVASALVESPPEPALPEALSREERIRQRAYEIYEHSGCIEGRDSDNWNAAEAEIDGRAL